MSETINRAYPLPDPNHSQLAGVIRIALALSNIDEDVAALIEMVGTKADGASIGPAIAAAIDALVAGAPGALDTLAEIAAKLAGNDDAVAAIIATIATKASQTDLNLLSTALADLATVVGTKANGGNVYSRSTVDGMFAGEVTARDAAISTAAAEARRTAIRMTFAQ